MPRRPSQQTDYEVASNALNYLNKAMTKIINSLRHTSFDDRHNLDNLIRALEYMDDARSEVLSVRKKIKKKDRKMKKWRQMIRGFNDESNNRIVSMPSDFFDFSNDEITQVLKR